MSVSRQASPRSGRRAWNPKRTFDVVASLTGLVCLSPVFALAALMVRLDSGGPVLFRQERVGRGFRPFRIYKFRTMVSDASARGGPLTAAEDPRITRVGRILRWTKIDELPQLINVVRGEMSLVGPRPEVRRYVNMFRADYEDILRVRPGITDLASLKYRDESAVLRSAVDPERMYVTRVLPDKIALSREYVGRSSFFFDLSLILKTLVRVAVGERGTPRRKSNEPGKRSLRRVLRTRRGPTPESTPEAAENSKEKDFPI